MIMFQNISFELYNLLCSENIDLHFHYINLTIEVFSITC